MSRRKSKQDKPISDIDFDGIANKFDQNIYGTTKGKLRHQLLINYLSPWIHSAEKLKVYDVGAGTGMMSLAFAEQGHDVCLSDQSIDVLDIARQRLHAFDNVNIQHQSLLDCNIVQPNLILCHAVLEWLEQPFLAIDQLLSTLPTGASLSLSFFNKQAMLFSNLLYGNFDYVEAGLQVRNRVRLSPQQALVPSEVIDYIDRHHADCAITHQAGLRVIHDYMFDRKMQIDKYSQLYQAELQYGQQEPFKWLGKYFHMIIKKE